MPAVVNGESIVSPGSDKADGIIHIAIGMNQLGKDKGLSSDLDMPELLKRSAGQAVADDLGMVINGAGIGGNGQDGSPAAVVLLQVVNGKDLFGIGNGQQISRR